MKTGIYLLSVYERKKVIIEQSFAKGFNPKTKKYRQNTTCLNKPIVNDVNDVNDKE